MSSDNAEAQIEGFLAKFTPEIAAEVAACRRKLRGRFRRGYELIYDNYNALVFGYGPTPSAADAVLSVAAYPRWVTLFFLQGATLADPEKRLTGSGRLVRAIRLTGPRDLDDPAVRALIEAAREPAAQWAQAGKLETLIKAVVAKQRPRRPRGR